MKRTMLLVAGFAVPLMLSASVSYGADPQVERMFKPAFCIDISIE